MQEDLTGKTSTRAADVERGRVQGGGQNVHVHANNLGRTYAQFESCTALTRPTSRKYRNIPTRARAAFSGWLQGVLLDWRHCSVDLVVILLHEIDIGRKFHGLGERFQC